MMASRLQLIEMRGDPGDEPEHSHDEEGARDDDGRALHRHQWASLRHTVPPFDPVIDRSAGKRYPRARSANRAPGRSRCQAAGRLSREARAPEFARDSRTPSAIMPTARARCSQLSALLTGTKFAALWWSMTIP